MPAASVAEGPTPPGISALTFAPPEAGTGEAELAWKRDDMHFPHSLAPLAQDYVSGPIAFGLVTLWGYAGVPMRTRYFIPHGYIYECDEPLASDADMEAAWQRADETWLALARRLPSFWEEEALPALREAYAWLQAAPIEAAPFAPLAELWDQLWERLNALWHYHFLVVGSSYQAAEHLANTYEALTKDAAPSDAFILIQALPNDLHRVETELHQLAQRARAWPAVAAALEQSLADVTARLAGLEGGPAFVEAMDAFLEQHGHLGQTFDDLALPAWGDEPELLLAEVRKRLAHTAEDPEERRLRLTAQAEALVETVRQRLRAGQQLAELERFDDALAVARGAAPLTEGHNYWLDRMAQAHAHRFAVRVGRRLVEASQLTAANDIFMLHKDEVRAALVEPRDLRALVAERKDALNQWRALAAPKYLGKPPDPANAGNRFSGRPQTQAQPDVVHGMGACAGTAQGTARVVTSQADFDRVLPGDILVCASSNPSWVPLFAIIGGVVTDTGGVLAHAAVVAREFGVPAVVGTGTGTQLIRDGQTVRIDGRAGVVYLHG